MKRAPAQPRLSYLIDTNLDGVKPQNVARRPSLPPSGLLFDESSLSPTRGDYGAVVMCDRIALARAIAARISQASSRSRAKLFRSPRSS